MAFRADCCIQLTADDNNNAQIMDWAAFGTLTRLKFALCRALPRFSCEARTVFWLVPCSRSPHPSSYPPIWPSTDDCSCAYHLPEEWLAVRFRSTRELMDCLGLTRLAFTAKPRQTCCK